MSGFSLSYTEPCAIYYMARTQYFFLLRNFVSLSEVIFWHRSFHLLDHLRKRFSTHDDNNSRLISPIISNFFQLIGVPKILDEARDRKIFFYILLSMCWFTCMGSLTGMAKCKARAAPCTDAFGMSLFSWICIKRWTAASSTPSCISLNNGSCASNSRLIFEGC